VNSRSFWTALVSFLSQGGLCVLCIYPGFALTLAPCHLSLCPSSLRPSMSYFPSRLKASSALMAAGTATGACASPTAPGLGARRWRQWGRCTATAPRHAQPAPSCCRSSGWMAAGGRATCPARIRWV
jgi:hypothetical protein